MADKRPGRGSEQFPLRLPDGMRERIRNEAERNGRSMNSEIVSRLEYSFEMPESELRAVARRISEEAVGEIRKALGGGEWSAENRKRAAGERDEE